MSGIAAKASRLIAELTRERRALPILRDELVATLPRLSAAAGEPDRRDLVLVAVDLHHYFTAIETAFERIARDIDDELPGGPDSHRLLIEQMAVSIPATRPAVIAERERAWLQSLRSFRHFFRNAYGADLEAAELARHGHLVLVHHAALMRAIDDFVTFLDALRTPA